MRPWKLFTEGYFSVWFTFDDFNNFFDLNCSIISHTISNFLPQISKIVVYMIH